MTINRAFTRIEEGEIHYRYAESDSDEVLYMIHSSPASSVILLPLIEQMSSSFKVIAITLNDEDICSIKGKSMTEEAGDE